MIDFTEALDAIGLEGWFQEWVATCVARAQDPLRVAWMYVMSERRVETA